MYDINLIKQTFEKNINQIAISISRLENVPNNSVFKIEAESQAYIFKIYRSNWPEDGKIPFVYRKLSEHNIPHAKLYVFNREDKNFTNGYSIEECLMGITADKLSLSEKDVVALYGKLAGLVSQFHRIEMMGYGYTGDGSPTNWETFSEYIRDVLDDNAESLITNGFIESAELKKVNKTIFEKLKCCDVFPPVLCHGDLSIKNIVINSSEITLIDWDDVRSLSWVADLARLTFWMRADPRPNKSIAAACRNKFLDYYETPHNKNIFYEVEDFLHIWYALDCLKYFINKGDENDICEKVKTLLEDIRSKYGI